MTESAAGRLAASLVAALLLHAVALRLLPAPSAADVPRKPVVVRLPARPPAMSAASRHAVSPIRREAAAQPAAPARPPAPAPVEAAVREEPRNAAPSAADLMASARRIARVEALRGTPAPNTGSPSRTPEAIIARALRQPAAGERRIGSELLKVTTAAGTTYCLKTPNDAPRGGVIEPLGVPTNCP